MVNIPRANTGGVKMTTQAPRQKQSPSANAMFGRSLQGVGQQVQQLGQQMKDLQDLKDYTAAKTEATKVMLEAKKAAERDETPWDMSGRYAEVMNEGMNTAMEKIRNPKIREQFKDSMGIAMMKANYDIGKLELKAQFAEAKAVLEQNLEVQHDLYFAAETKKERDLIEAESREMVKAFVNKQGVHGEAAKDMIEDSMESMKLTAIDYDLEKDTEAALIELQKGNDGKYADVQEHIRQKKMKDGEAKLRHDRSVAILMTKIGQEKVDTITMEQYKAGSLDSVELRERIIKGMAGDEGGMTPSLGKAIASLMKADVNVTRTINEKVVVNDELDNQFEQMFLNRDDEIDMTQKVALEEIAKYREAVILKQADGYLSAGEAETRLGKVERIFNNGINDRVIERLGQENNIWGDLKDWAMFSLNPYGYMGSRWLNPPTTPATPRVRDQVMLDLRRAFDNRLEMIDPSRPLSHEEKKNMVNDLKTSYIHQLFPELVGTQMPNSVYTFNNGLVIMPEVDTTSGDLPLDAVLRVDENDVYSPINPTETAE